MDALRRLAFGPLVLVGSAFGGYLAQQQPPPNVGVNEVLRVPDSGLRMVSNSGKLVGMVALRGGNGALVLFDGAGRPSVVLSGGAQGTLEFEGSAGGELRVSSSSRRSAVLAARLDSAELALDSGVRLEARESRARMVLKPKAGTRSLELECETQAASVAAKSGSAAVFRLAGERQGLLQLAASSAKPGVVADGDGSLAVFKDGEAVFRVPDGG